MLKDIIRTGSISQDALRLGFQTTCSKGIGKLLKVDDITITECAKFKEEHIAKVEEELKIIEKQYTSKLVNNFEIALKDDYYAPNNLIFRWFYYNYINSLKNRVFNVKLLEASKATLDLEEGMWVTKVKLEVKKEKWEGKYRGVKTTLKEETYIKTENITTRAMKCNVAYTAYDKYHNKYIPDEAAEAAAEAIQIGMTELKVAYPKVAKSVEPDPIIIGHVGEQMFIIAWFGYDKNNHMSCNI